MKKTTLYVTENSLYYVREGVCIGVYRPKVSRWDTEHPAVAQRLSCGVRIDRDGRRPIIEAGRGDSLFFEVPCLLTSAILDIIVYRDALVASRSMAGAA